MESKKKINSTIPSSFMVQKQVLASMLGSIVSTFVLNPVGMIKTKLQNGEKNIPSIIKNTYKSGGIFGFWGGVKVGLAHSLPSSILYMTLYENIRDYIVRPCIKTTYQLDVTAGIAAGIARCIVVTTCAPIDIIRTIQLSGSHASMFQIGRDIHNSEGLRGFYRGIQSAMLRDTPFSVIYWLCFESLKGNYTQLVNRFKASFYKSNDSQSAHSPLATFIAGSSSGTIATIFTHPFDVIKTQTQLKTTASTISASMPVSVNTAALAIDQCNTCTCETYSASHTCESLVQACKEKMSMSLSKDSVGHRFAQLLKHEGIRGLYRGLTLRLATVIPGGGIMITVYETTKLYFQESLIYIDES